MSGEHLVEVDGVLEIQSDKYPTTPAGLVPLKTTDPDARDLLWIYAKRHEEKDPDFSADILQQLLAMTQDPTTCQRPTG